MGIIIQGSSQGWLDDSAGDVSLFVGVILMLYHMVSHKNELAKAGAVHPPTGRNAKLHSVLRRTLAFAGRATGSTGWQV